VSTRIFTAMTAALFSVWLVMGMNAPVVQAQEDVAGDADKAAEDATAVTGEGDEYFESCRLQDGPMDPDSTLATQTFEPLSKRKNNFLSVRIKGRFETPGPGYIMVWRKDKLPSLSATAAMELRVLRPLNVYIQGQKEFVTTVDKTVVVSPETTTLRVHTVLDYGDDITFYCKIKPVSLRARNEMDLE